MAHVELSVEPIAVSGHDARPDPGGSLARWGRTVTEADEPCLVLNGDLVIVAASVRACRLLGFADQKSAVGKVLTSSVVPLVDFTSPPVPLPDGDLEKIPPRLAYSSRQLARGLLRVATATEVHTIDAVATPLFDVEQVVGSLTFLSQI